MIPVVRRIRRRMVLATPLAATAAIGLLIAVVPTASAGPTTLRQPDAAIKLAKDSSYFGEAIWNANGFYQTRSCRSHRRRTRTFEVKLANAGNVSDAFEVSGPGSSPGFGVRYLVAGKDVTRAVTEGT